MEYQKQLAYMAAGDVIEGFYLLKSASVRTAANGKPYLNAVLADASGTMEAKMWDFQRYQKVVDILKDQVLFVQVGQKNPTHIHKPLKNEDFSIDTFDKFFNEEESIKKPKKSINLPIECSPISYRTNNKFNDKIIFII